MAGVAHRSGRMVEARLRQSPGTVDAPLSSPPDLPKIGLPRAGQWRDQQNRGHHFRKRPPDCRRYSGSIRRHQEAARRG